MWIPIALILIAIAAAVVDLLEPADEDKPRWPTRIRFVLALLVALIGLYEIAQGYMARRVGLAAYNNEHDLNKSIKHIERAEASFFANRETKNALGLSYKNIADNASDEGVRIRYYEKAAECFTDILARDKLEAPAANNLVNISRRMRDWTTLSNRVATLNAMIDLGPQLREHGKPIKETALATLHVTIGNVYADDANPLHSPQRAVESYREALRINPRNPFVRLNLPVQLVVLCTAETNAASRLQYLQEAYDMASKWDVFVKDIDKIFSLGNAMAAIIEADGLPLRVGPVTLKNAMDEIHKLQSVWSDVDYEIWLIAAKASLLLGEIDRCRYFLVLALLHESRFTPAQQRLRQEIEADIACGGSV